jgi:hypothetical protein
MSWITRQTSRGNVTRISRGSDNERNTGDHDEDDDENGEKTMAMAAEVARKRSRWS